MTRRSRFGSNASNKALSINSSVGLGQSVKQEVANTEAENWAKENKNAIKSYNDFIEQNGCFGDEFRTF